MLPLILVILVGLGVWRTIDAYDRAGRERPQPTMPGGLGPRGRKVAKRIVIVALTWAVVTVSVGTFIATDIGLFAGMVVVVLGAFWVFKTADPLQINMDELDKELMKLIEDEG